MRGFHGFDANYALVRTTCASQGGGMDLYISPLSCSFAAHVALLEAELPVTLHRVDRRTKCLDDGTDYRVLAPLANVPALADGKGTLLTEMAAVMQWIADLAPAKGLAPRWGTPERYTLIAWLHFVSTEIHKKHLWMIFSSKTPPAVKDWARQDPSAPLDFAEKHLRDRTFLLGETLTVADLYLYWTLMVLPFAGIPLGRWPALEAFAARLRERPTVKAALAIELPMFQKEQAERPAAERVALGSAARGPAPALQGRTGALSADTKSSVR
jgi:glutathione S-transferase